MFAVSAARSFGAKTDESLGRKRYEALAHHALDFILRDMQARVALASDAATDWTAEKWTAQSEVPFAGANRDRRADVVLESDTAEGQKRLVIELKVHAPLYDDQAADNLAYARSSGEGKLWIVAPKIRQRSIAASVVHLGSDVRVLGWDDLARIGAHGGKKHLWRALGHYVTRLVEQTMLDDVSCLENQATAAEFELLLQVFLDLAQVRNPSRVPGFSVGQRQIGEGAWLQKGATVSSGDRNWGLVFGEIREYAFNGRTWLSDRTPIVFKRQTNSDIDHSGTQSSRLGSRPNDEDRRQVFESYRRSGTSPLTEVLDGLPDKLFGTPATLEFAAAQKILFAAMGRILDVLKTEDLLARKSTTAHPGGRAHARSISDRHRFGVTVDDLDLQVWMGPPIGEKDNWEKLGVWINDERVWPSAHEDARLRRPLWGDEYVDLVESRFRDAIDASRSHAGLRPSSHGS